jgi:hypothetical protein
VACVFAGLVMLGGCDRPPPATVDEAIRLRNMGEIEESVRALAIDSVSRSRTSSRSSEVLAQSLNALVAESVPVGATAYVPFGNQKAAQFGARDGLVNAYRQTDSKELFDRLAGFHRRITGLDTDPEPLSAVLQRAGVKPPASP